MTIPYQSTPSTQTRVPLRTPTKLPTTAMSETVPDISLTTMDNLAHRIPDPHLLAFKHPPDSSPSIIPSKSPTVVYKTRTSKTHCFLSLTSKTKPYAGACVPPLSPQDESQNSAKLVAPFLPNKKHALASPPAAPDNTNIGTRHRGQPHKFIHGRYPDL